MQTQTRQAVVTIPTIQELHKFHDHVQSVAKQDKEQSDFLLESFAIEFARKDRRTIPLDFASYSEEDGLILVKHWR